ncbi:unnamed protein product [Thlaspi arvense]|uniref:Apple domain-containing protein n=1 Tax=Thlaspi arvense TaxID=13288 RepID=A0AAU9RLU9_THLAR|nr:unnamed protein product [Thlaspi arvense]
MCQCPPVLSSSSQSNCKPDITSPCNHSKDSLQLVEAGNGLSYFALHFVTPTSKTDLDGCKASCSSNCSCLALFFDQHSGNCFLFDGIGSFQKIK